MGKGSTNQNGISKNSFKAILASYASGGRGREQERLWIIRGGAGKIK